jgi:hypothetical protein
MPFKWGFEFNFAHRHRHVPHGGRLGDRDRRRHVSGITKGGAGREATDKEIEGATFADGLGTAVAGVFGGLPNTSFSQNVGLIAMTGVMSRHVVTIGAIFLIVCGFIPKVGALINTVPINVLGGGVIVMFGMVCAAGVNMLSEVNWNRRNMVIFATALSISLGLQLEPEAPAAPGQDRADPADQRPAAGSPDRHRAQPGAAGRSRRVWVGCACAQAAGDIRRRFLLPGEWRRCCLPSLPRRRH